MSDASPPGSGPTELTADERGAIDEIWERRMTATHYELLGVPRTADRKAIRDAYFNLSKRFHPDVFFRRELGVYRSRIDEVFRMLTRAYDVLSNPRQRAGYDLHLANLESRPPPPGEDPSPVSIARPPPVPSVAPTPPPPRPVPAAAMPSDAVVPPPVRPGNSVPASPHTASTPPTPSQPVDPAVRQRALEAMRRRLGAVVQPQRTSLTPAAPLPHAPVMPPSRSAAEEREARAARLISDGEEAQKKGDFVAALECFRGALQINKDDLGIKARVDAVDQLVKTQRTSENIEKAREAMRDGKADLAAGYWEKAWEGRPTDATLLVNAAEVLARFGNNRGKVKELAQRALAVDPKNVKAHVILAQVFTAAGLKASARGAIDSIAKIDPNHPSLKELREKLGPLTLAEQLGLRGR